MMIMIMQHNIARIHKTNMLLNTIKVYKMTMQPNTIKVFKMTMLPSTIILRLKMITLHNTMHNLQLYNQPNLPMTICLGSKNKNNGKQIKRLEENKKHLKENWMNNNVLMKEIKKIKKDFQKSRKKEIDMNKRKKKEDNQKSKKMIGMNKKLKSCMRLNMEMIHKLKKFRIMKMMYGNKKILRENQKIQKENKKKTREKQKKNCYINKNQKEKKPKDWQKKRKNMKLHLLFQPALLISQTLVLKMGKRRILMNLISFVSNQKKKDKDWRKYKHHWQPNKQIQIHKVKKLQLWMTKLMNKKLQKKLHHWELHSILLNNGLKTILLRIDYLLNRTFFNRI